MKNEYDIVPLLDPDWDELPLPREDEEEDAE